MNPDPFVAAVSALVLRMRAAEAHPSWAAMLDAAAARGVSFDGLSWGSELEIVEGLLRGAARIYPESLTVDELRTIFDAPRVPCSICRDVTKGPDPDCERCHGLGLEDREQIQCPVCWGDGVAIVPQSDAVKYNFRIV